MTRGRPGSGRFRKMDRRGRNSDAVVAKAYRTICSGIPEGAYSQVQGRSLFQYAESLEPVGDPCHVPSRESLRTWLRVRLDLLKAERPVVVSRSMSGRFSLPLVTEAPER